MPFILGETVEETKEILDALDLDLQYVESKEYCSDVDKDCVIRTEPENGAALKTGDTVKLFISKGPELKKMQKLVGLSVNAAIEILKGDNFTTMRSRLSKATKQRTRLLNSLWHPTPKLI